MGKRILVVDDEKNIRFTVVHALKAESFQVDAAASGVEGLNLFRGNDYDLLLIDLRMPGMTGLEMLREIRRTVAHAPPAVIITAYGVPQQMLEAASLGAIDCVRKPFSIQMIRDIIHGIFERVGESDGRPPATASEYLAKGKREMMNGDMAGAEKSLESATEIDPGLVDAYLCLGVCTLLIGNRSQDAIAHFRHVLQIDPVNKTAGEYLAWLAES
jgi:DNA-binding response OmpR family regulator